MFGESSCIHNIQQIYTYSLSLISVTKNLTFYFLNLNVNDFICHNFNIPVTLQVPIRKTRFSLLLAVRDFLIC